MKKNESKRRRKKTKKGLQQNSPEPRMTDPLLCDVKQETSVWLEIRQQKTPEAERFEQFHFKHPAKRQPENGFNFATKGANPEADFTDADMKQ